MKRQNKLLMIINDSQIHVIKISGDDYICLTDMAKSAGSNRALHSWLRTKNIFYILHKFVYFKNNAGGNNYNLQVF